MSVKLAHGAGGKEMEEIIKELIVSKLREEEKKVLGGIGLDIMDDGATIPHGDLHLVISTDSYTVKPIFFPGGDIGRLAVCGSINDVVVMGARPVAILDSVVVEEGMPIDQLERILDSMISVIREEGIPLIGGDFKVMPRGEVDQIVITTTAVGRPIGKPIVDNELRPGDKIVVTGSVGDHGATILALQQGVEVSLGQLTSDVRPLTRTLIPIFEKFGGNVHAARDPTRGGIASALNDWAESSRTLILLKEDLIPV